MKIKNSSARNVSAMGKHLEGEGLPFRITVPAGATLEITDEEYKVVKPDVTYLVDAGVLIIVEAPATKFTKAQIAEAIKVEADVVVSESKTKDELVKLAASLNVSLEED